jgi:hypothetical protein
MQLHFTNYLSTQVWISHDPNNATSQRIAKLERCVIHVEQEHLFGTCQADVPHRLVESHHILSSDNTRFPITDTSDKGHISLASYLEKRIICMTNAAQRLC